MRRPNIWKLTPSSSGFNTAIGYHPMRRPLKNRPTLSLQGNFNTAAGLPPLRQPRTRCTVGLVICFNTAAGLPPLRRPKAISVKELLQVFQYRSRVTPFAATRIDVWTSGVLAVSIPQQGSPLCGRLTLGGQLWPTASFNTAAGLPPLRLGIPV